MACTSESSRANGSRWGGMQASWGYSEGSAPATADGQIGRVQFVQNRLLLQTQVSRDLMQDSASIGRWLKYTALAEIRYCIEDALINGSGISLGTGAPCPMGVLAAPATISVKRASGGTIGAGDIDTLWSKMYAGCLPNAVWHCGPDTLKAIDSIPTGGQYPELLYARPGQGDNGVFGTIKGRPVIVLDQMPALGTAGDLVVCDWTQYVLTFLQLNAIGSPLSFSFEPPRDDYHRGLIGLPEGAVESRFSEDVLFATDIYALMFKFRGDGGFLWPQTKTTAASVKVGPAAQLV
jgi:HK97 family phage major capsid protein